MPSPRLLALSSAVALALATSLFVGCGEKEKSAAELTASELLELIQLQQPEDARAYVEFDLGRFRGSHRLSGRESQVYVQFHLFGVLLPEKETRLVELLPQYEKRVRDAVIGLIQRTEIEQLTDPSLAFFKGEVASAVNRVLQEQLLVDVAFSDFSMDRDAGMPWSTPAPVKPAGGHGGGGHGGGGHGGGHGGH